MIPAVRGPSRERRDKLHGRHGCHDHEHEHSAMVHFYSWSPHGGRAGFDAPGGAATAQACTSHAGLGYVAILTIPWGGRLPTTQHEPATNLGWALLECVVMTATADSSAVHNGLAETRFAFSTCHEWRPAGLRIARCNVRPHHVVRVGSAYGVVSYSHRGSDESCSW